MIKLQVTVTDGSTSSDDNTDSDSGSDTPLSVRVSQRKSGHTSQKAPPAKKRPTVAAVVAAARKTTTGPAKSPMATDTVGEPSSSSSSDDGTDSDSGSDTPLSVRVSQRKSGHTSQKAPPAKKRPTVAAVVAAARNATAGLNLKGPAKSPHMAFKVCNLRTVT
jgi:hypothetical protein